MKNFKQFKNVFLGIMGCGIICFTLFHFCSTIFTQFRLKLNGEKGTAIVKKVWLYKAYPHAMYEFEVNGKLYYGDKGDFPIDVAVNDSICIIFLPSNPEINMASED